MRIANIGGLQKLERVTMGWNNFNTTLDPAWGNMTAAIQWSLQDCNLRGNIPWQLGRAQDLETLELQDNLLEGELDARLFMWRPYTVNLANNNFYGELPQNFTTWRFYRTINLSDNNFSGEIPVGWGNTYYLQFIHFQNNNFTGTIPEDLWGYVPAQAGFWNGLKLYGNQLSGCVQLTNVPTSECELCSSGNEGLQLEVSSVSLCDCTNSTCEYTPAPTPAPTPSPTVAPTGDCIPMINIRDNIGDWQTGSAFNQYNLTTVHCCNWEGVRRRKKKEIDHYLHN